MNVTLRPLTRADFGMLATWLAEPLVARWWAHEHFPAAVERDFGPNLDGADPAEFFVAELDGWAYGLIQCYRLADFPEYVAELAPITDVPAGALSIDYLVGEPAARGRGLGTAMIDEMVRTGWEHHPGAGHVLVPVAHGNRASRRALERAGFTRVAEGPLVPDNPIDPPEHVVYLRRRAQDQPSPASSSTR